MPRLITEKEFYIEIYIDDVADLFKFYTNPNRFFKDQNKEDARGFPINYESIFQKLFMDVHDVEIHHEHIYSKEYFRTDLWKSFIFRGQSNPKWSLETTLFREYNRLGKDYNKRSLYNIEQMILRDFKRQYNRFGRHHLIKDKDYYEWFSLMQHHGVPTRFLDFTYSFYVALYFASNNIAFLEDDTVEFAIYAINRTWLEKRYKNFLSPSVNELYDIDPFGKDLKIQDAVVNNKDNVFTSVINMSPYHLNSRQVNQKGIFLLPTNINLSFEENLNNMLVDEGGSINDKVIKVVIELNREDLIYLYKQLNHMNIGAQTLFENKLDSMGEILKRKLIESLFSDVLSINKQGKSLT